jgi:hypothetical protein
VTCFVADPHLAKVSQPRRVQANRRIRSRRRSRDGFHKPIVHGAAAQRRCVSGTKRMPTAHLYLFSDACPSDWLVDGQDDTWHTIVNFVFQSAPELQQQLESGTPHWELLALDVTYLDFVRSLSSGLASQQLRKWGTSPSYRSKFCRAFSEVAIARQPMLSACSFQEKTLRSSKKAVLASYNHHIGGSEGRGIGFEEWRDVRGRLRMADWIPRSGDFNSRRG